MSIQLFKVEDGELVINKPEILLEVNLGTILRRDKDRNKKQAFKEFAYIFYTRDPEAFTFKHGFNEEETHIYAIEHTKLDDSWKPDDIVKKAQDEYTRVNGNVIKDVIRESLIAFANYTKIIRLVRKHIDKLLKQAEESDTDLGVDEINKLIQYSNQLIEIGQAIPTVKDKLQNSLAVVERSMDINDNTDLLRGSDQVVPTSFMPENDE